MNSYNIVDHGLGYKNWTGAWKWRACRWVRLVAPALLCVGLSAQAGAPRYQLSYLDDVAGDTSSYPASINNMGDIVGVAQNDLNKQQATLWHPGSAAVHIGGVNTTASYINDVGQAVGTHYKDENNDYWSVVPYAARFGAQGIIFDLPVPGVIQYSASVNGHAVGIDETGAVYGTSAGMDSQFLPLYYRASRWSRSGVLTNLTEGFEIRHFGKGGLLLGVTNQQAATWLHGRLTLLLNLPGTTSCEAVAANKSGLVVGHCDSGAPGISRAVVWHGTLPSELKSTERGDSKAYDVNGLGQIVGVNRGKPVMWWQGEVINLSTQVDSASSTPGWTLTTVFGINDSGWMAATAVNATTSQSHTVLLKPE